MTDTWLFWDVFFVPLHVLTVASVFQVQASLASRGFISVFVAQIYKKKIKKWMFMCDNQTIVLLERLTLDVFI